MKRSLGESVNFMRGNRHPGVFVVLGLLLLLSGRAWADPGIELLMKMSHASEALDYSGEFVYVSEGRISTLRIAHMRATDSQSSQQKLMAMDGSMREIIQRDEVVACVLPDQKMGVREKRQSRQLFTLNVGDMAEQIQRHYQVEALGQDRVADRDCNKIRVAPLDAYRYGYLLCIDGETSLLLSSELYSGDDQVIEAYRFISLQLDEVDVQEIDSRTPPQMLDWHDDEGAKREQATVTQRWRVQDNPTGFVTEHYIERYSPMLEAQIVHLVLGDGLAQISVFITPAPQSTEINSASVSMGSLNSATQRQDEHMITVIGEVPVITAQMIAGNTRMDSN